MKTPVFPHMVAVLIIGTVTPLFAQTSVDTPRFFEAGHPSDDLAGDNVGSNFSATSVLSGKYEVPTTEKAKGDLRDAQPVYTAQDARTLDPRTTTSQNVEAVVDLGVLRNPSPYRKLGVSSTALKSYEIVENSLQNGLARISAVYREGGKPEKSSDCPAVALSVEQRIRLDISKALEVVESEVSANPGCACEIVKASIAAMDADVSMVVSIVRVSINAAPENMRIISQCAIAAMPESINEVQALLAKIDPNSGDTATYSSKSSKSAKSAKDPKVASIVSDMADPLNRLFVPLTAPILNTLQTPNTPPIVTTPPVTNVDPSTGFDS